MMECMTGTASGRKANAAEDIIGGEKKETEWGKVLKGPPRVWSITLQNPPTIPLPFGDDTVKCPSPHWGGNGINAPNNYTDIPRKPVLSTKALLQMRFPQRTQAWNSAT